MNISISRREKYLIFTTLITALMYFILFVYKESGVLYISLLIFLTLVGQYITNIPNSKLVNTLVSGIINVCLIVGFILCFLYFPNLSRLFKLITLAGFSILFYLSLLINNVFLVVEYRKETIPLYRVALTWSKIVLAAVSIPLLAGFFKISLNPVYEGIIACLASFLYYYYFIWTLSYNKDIKKYKTGEIISLIIFGMFLVLLASFSVSFFPSESFLRALFVASILIFAITYIESHLKNSINRQLITEHIVISIIFFILTIIFAS